MPTGRLQIVAATARRPTVPGRAVGAGVGAVDATAPDDVTGCFEP